MVDDFTCLVALNDLSLEAFVAAITKKSFITVTTPLSSVLSVFEEALALNYNILWPLH